MSDKRLLTTIDSAYWISYLLKHEKKVLALLIIKDYTTQYTFFAEQNFNFF